MTATARSYIFLSLTVIVWASSYTITKQAVHELPPVLFAILRFAVASAALLLLSIGRPHPPRFFRDHFKSIVLLAVTGITCYYLFFNFAFTYTTASTGALIQGFIPVAVVILAAIFLKEKISAWQLVGVILSVAGVIVMSLAGKTTGEATNPLKGNIFIIVSVFLWASYTVISKKQAKADAAWLTIYSTILGTILMLPIYAIEQYHHPFPAISLRAWCSIFYLGIFASALSYYWYNSALKNLKASTVGTFLNVDPVIGAIIAIVVLGEPLLPLQVGGVVLVLIGVWLSTRSTSIKSAQPV